MTPGWFLVAMLGGFTLAGIIVFNVTTKIFAWKKAWSGYRFISPVKGGVQRGAKGEVSMGAPAQPHEILTSKFWWKCVLPWPGKRKWMDTVITKAVLAGAVIEFQAVSVWDWDEAWVVIVDDEQIIASSSRVATALAYLKHKGVEA